MKYYKVQYYLLKALGLALIPLLFLSSCNFHEVDCETCYQIEPDSSDLVVYVTINKQNLKVPLVIYKGKREDNVVDWVDTAYDATYYLYVLLNEYYTVEATYKNGHKTIIAVDGDKIKKRTSYSDCDTTCYYITGGYVDCRLKYNEDF